MTVMIAAIRKAARGVQRDYGEVSGLQVSVKGPADFVTNSDKKAEKVLRDELIHAEKCMGAFMNNKRMRVGGRKELSESMLFCGLPNRADKTHELQRKELGVMQTKTAGIRSLGSTALDMAFTAMGRFDGGWHHGLKPWDLAAGILFIKEAGGFVNGIDGEDYALNAGGYVCGNADLLPQIKAALDEAKKL